MIQRYFTEPYRFIPPHQGTFWCRLFDAFVPTYLRRVMKVTHWRYEGLEHLKHSLAQSHGILITANHSCRPDPMVLANLGLQCSSFFYYVVSYHLFQQGRFTGWLTNRLGGFSVLREGADRESIRVTSQLLASGDRPVVLFPEGTWFRQNDRLGPLQKGVGLIARQALKQATRPLVIHPTAIKYWLIENPTQALLQRIAKLERHCGSKENPGSLIDRVRRLHAALIEYAASRFGLPMPDGTADERIALLTEQRVCRLESDYFERNHSGTPLDRIRRLRHRLVGQLAQADPSERTRLQLPLDELLLCENLLAHSLDYLDEKPTLERLTETVLRLEETLLDQDERPPAPMGAVVSVGAALDLNAMNLAHNDDLLIETLRASMQSQLDDLVRQGPPSDWPHPALPPRSDKASLPLAQTS